MNSAVCTQHDRQRLCYLSICDAPAVGNRTREEQSAFRVLHRPAESVRIGASRADLGATCSLGVPRNIIAAIRGFRDGMRVRMRPDDGERAEWFEVNDELRRGCVLSSLFFNMIFVAVLHVLLMRFSEDGAIMANLVHLEEVGVSRETEQIDRARRWVLIMLYPHSAGVISKSPKGITDAMTVIMIVFEAAGLTVSDKKTETIRSRTPHQKPPHEPLVVEVADQGHKQTNQCIYLGGLVDENAEISPEVERRIRLA